MLGHMDTTTKHSKATIDQLHQVTKVLPRKKKERNKKGSKKSKTKNIDPILKSPQKQITKSKYTFRS